MTEASCPASVGLRGRREQRRHPNRVALERSEAVIAASPGDCPPLVPETGEVVQRIVRPPKDVRFTAQVGTPADCPRRDEYLAPDAMLQKVARQPDGFERCAERADLPVRPVAVTVPSQLAVGGVIQERREFGEQL